MKILLLIILTSSLAGCRTVSESSLNDSELNDNKVVCAFESALGGGEKFQVSATPAGRTLNNLKELHSSPRKVTGKVQNLGSAPQVALSALTANGARNLRTVYKDLVDVDPKFFDCFGLENAREARFLCLAKTEEGGGLAAVFATNTANQHFAVDLTAFQSTCTVK